MYFNTRADPKPAISRIPLVEFLEGQHPFHLGHEPELVPDGMLEVFSAWQTCMLGGNFFHVHRQEQTMDPGPTLVM